MVSDKREGTAIKGLKAHLTRLAASVGRPLRRLLGPEAIPIAPQDAAELLKQGHPLVFLDARNSAAWSEAQMKLPGARRIELDDIDTVSNELPQDALIVTYCT